MEYHIVKDQENLKRDPITGAILETDAQAYQKHLQEKRLVMKTKDVSERVENLENKMDQILSLLQQSINNK